MHVASTTLFEGPAPAVPRVSRPHRLAAAPGAPLSPEASLRPLRPGTSGLGRRPPPEPRLPRPPHLVAAARQRAATPPPGCADLLPAPRPLEAPLGAVAGRGPQRRALRDRRQDPSLPRRRDLRRRHHHRALRPRARARIPRRWRSPSLAARAGTERLAPARRGPGRARGQPAGDSPRGALGAARPPPRHRQGHRYRRGRGLLRLGRDRSAGFPLQRRDRAAPEVHLGPRLPARPEAGQGPARRHRQRRRPRGRLRRPGTLSALTRSVHRRPRAAGDGAGERPLRRSAGRARQPADDDDGPAAGLVRGPGRACTWSPSRWGT